MNPTRTVRHRLLPACALLLWASALVPTTFAQDPVVKETPRAILERGAYAEEHQRAFDEAAKLYAQAEEAAKAAGDEATAKEAAAARARIATRMGQAPANAQADPTVPGYETDPITIRIADLLSNLPKYDRSNSYREKVISDLNLFGARVVPTLERILAAEDFQLARRSIRGDSPLGAEILARMLEPEASQALERGLKSPDPLVRSAIATALQIDPKRHRALLEQLARDPVPKVRGAALSALASSDDSSLLPLMEAAARSGETEAMGWMSWKAGTRLFDLALAPGTPEEVRVHALMALGKSSSLPADANRATALLELARTAKSEAVRGAALDTLTNLFLINWKLETALQEQVESRLLAELLQWPQRSMFALLQMIGGVRTLDALAASYASGKLSYPDDNSRGPAELCFGALLNRSQSFTFESLTEVFRKLPAPPPDASNTSAQKEQYALLAMRLAQRVGARTPSAEAIAHGFEGLDEAHQLAYLQVLENRVRQSKASLPASLEPVLLPALASYLPDLPAQWIFEGIVACGDVRAIENLLPYVNSHDPANRGIVSLSRRDPEQAMKIIESAVGRELRKGAQGDPAPLGALALLPANEAMSAFERLWPLATTERAKGDCLQVLAQSIGGSPGTAVLLAHYGDIPANRSDVRADAVARFGAELLEPAIPILGEALKDPEEHVRLQARAAFKAFKEHREALEEYSAWMNADKQQRESIAELMKLLDSANRDVAIGAVRALAAVKARSALPALVKLLERPDPELKKAVQDALAKMGE
jgi:HEAT repeat protein